MIENLFVLHYLCDAFDSTVWFIKRRHKAHMKICQEFYHNPTELQIHLSEEGKKTRSSETQSPITSSCKEAISLLWPKVMPLPMANVIQLQETDIEIFSEIA